MTSLENKSPSAAQTSSSTYGAGSVMAQDYLFVVCEQDIPITADTLSGKEDLARKVRESNFDDCKKNTYYLRANPQQQSEIDKFIAGKEEIHIARRVSGSSSYDYFLVDPTGSTTAVPPIIASILSGQVSAKNPKKIGLLSSNTLYVPVRLALQGTASKSPMSPHSLAASGRSSSPLTVPSGARPGQSPRSPSVYFPMSVK